MFTKDLKVELIKGTDNRKLLSEITYEDITVPEGFITDFASIPKWVPRWFMDDDSPKIRMPSVVHDYLYRTGKLTRKQADKVLLKGMLELGASRFKAYTIYLAVRLFGGNYWNGLTSK